MITSDSLSIYSEMLIAGLYDSLISLIHYTYFHSGFISLYCGQHLFCFLGGIYFDWDEMESLCNFDLHFPNG